MGQKVKWKVIDIKKDSSELNLTEFMYTKRIIPFIRKVTKEDVLDNLQAAGLLTQDIAKVIEQS